MKNTKKNITRIKIAIVTVAFLGVGFATNLGFATICNHKAITCELIKLVKQNPKIGTMLEASIAEAKKKNPDKKTNPVQNLAEYYNFIDTSSELIPRAMLNNTANLTRDNILQSICYFYFLIDQPLAQLKNKGLFKNTMQYYPPFSSWLKNFAKTWGTFLSTKKSWNKKIYQEFYNNPGFGLRKGWYEPAANWNTFNRFFSRYLKAPGVRPIASPDNPAVVVSPADSVPQGMWAIDTNSNIHTNNGLKVKMVTYYNIASLLAEDSQYKNAFANGILTHTFLNVNDYHRYHFAVGGTIKEKKLITQNFSLEVIWSPQTKKYIPIDSMGWQFSQTRGYVIVDTGKYGIVALIPVGMAQLSSVNFEDNVKVGTVHKKGDMLGTFLFGGSDFLMLFQKKSGFEMTAPEKHQVIKKDQSHYHKLIPGYKHILMGKEYGVMRGEG